MAQSTELSVGIAARAAGADIPCLDRQSFRDGMARLAAAVNIITTVEDGRPFGFTASAVSSVTDDPPTLLVCINRESQSHPVISRSGFLCVNTLADRHQPLGLLFAGKTKDMATRFAAAEWSTRTTGAPVLTDATVAFDCRVQDVVGAGTHDIFLCRVEAVHCGADASALVYFNRAFHGLAGA